MKKYAWIPVILVSCMAGFVGCKKSDSSSGQQTVGFEGVDVRALRDAFQSGPPEAQIESANVGMFLRYGDNAKAMASLEKLAAMPNLNDKQKKIVNTSIEQLKPKMGAPAQ
jgi:hypothetical protein